MREFLKILRKEENGRLIQKLNYNQVKYNNAFDLMYKYNCKDESTRYNLNLYLSNMNKIKQVLEERNIKIQFLNGWEIIY